MLSRPHEYPLLRLGVAPLSDAEHPPFQMLDHGGLGRVLLDGNCRDDVELMQHQECAYVCGEDQ